MPRPPNPTTPEAKVLTRAIDGLGVGAKARIAEKLDVTPGLISQFANGHRPVPWERAEALAAEVGLDPEQISEEYRKILARFGSSHSVQLDGAKLAALIEAVDLAAARSKKRVSVNKKAQAVVAVYLDDEAWVAGEKAVAALLAKYLATTEEA